ncbi:MAG: hypothetical protein NZ750_09110 [Anaerolineae bacterium]|nr:hypothetical protein [Anaerolineae bacterium]MDW8171777.1 hypothetical protein [Anaerolineae bacterium]
MKTARRLSFVVALLVLLLCLGLAITRPDLGFPAWVVATAAISSAVVLIFSAVAEVRSWQLPEPEDPPVPSEPIKPRAPQSIVEDPLLRAERKLRDAEDFANRLNGKHKIRVESDDDDSPPAPRPPYGGTPR